MNVGVDSHLETAPLSQPIYKRFLGVRYTDFSETITSGSFSDIPTIYPGTNDWPLWTPEQFKLARPKFILDDSTSDVSTQNPDYSGFDRVVAQLEAASQAGDERAFVRAEKTLDWIERQPDDYIRVIQLALAAGAFQVARRLAEEGNYRFPGHTDIQKSANVLAPPKAIRSERANHPGLRLNHDWLKNHSDLFHNKWVALKNGELLGSASSFKELIDQVAPTQGILFTKVY